MHAQDFNRSYICSHSQDCFYFLLYIEVLFPFRNKAAYLDRGKKMGNGVILLYLKMNQPTSKENLSLEYVGTHASSDTADARANSYRKILFSKKVFYAIYLSFC